MTPAEIRALLARRVGPLPIGAWLAVVAVGVAVTAAVIRKRRGPAPEPADADDTATTLPPNVVGSGFAVGGLNPGTGSGIPSDAFEQSPPELRTNSDWEVAAQRWAIGKGYQPTIAAGALAKYLMGEQLDPQELAIVDAALVANGPPPEPVPPPQAKPSPTSPSLPGNGSGSSAPSTSQGGAVTRPSVTTSAGAAVQRNIGGVLYWVAPKPATEPASVPPAVAAGQLAPYYNPFNRTPAQLDAIAAGMCRVNPQKCVTDVNARRKMAAHAPPSSLASTYHLLAGRDF